MKRISRILTLLFLAGFLNQSLADSRIAFVRSVSEDTHDAWVVNLDGTNQQRITSGHCVISTKWLDSKTVAVISQADIWLIKVNEDNCRGRATRLTEFGDVINLSCSADGKWLAFTRANYESDKLPEGVTLRLSIIDRNGENYQVLKDIDNDMATDLISCFGPRGVFYTSNDFENGNVPVICRIDLSDRRERVIFSFPYVEPHGPSEDIIDDLDCSKGGQKIIFSGFLHRDSLGKIISRSFLKLYDIEKQQGKTILQTNNISLGCSFMPGEKEILIGYLFSGRSNSDLCTFSLSSPSKPKLLVRDGFWPDVWY